MNLNGIKTAILGSGLLAMVGPYLLSLALSVFGCTGDDPATKDIIEVAVCTGGSLFTIPAGLQALIGGLVIAGALALTGFFKTGSFMQNLFAPSVPVVPKEQAKVGVVTMEQVEEPGPGKKEFSDQAQAAKK